MRSFLALPPCIARMESAWPKTQGMPSSSQRSASQVPGEQALDANHHIRTAGSWHLEKQVGSGADVLVHAHLAVGIDDAEVHPVDVQVDVVV